MSDLDETRVVHVATAPNEAIAEMWKEMLEVEGVIVALKPGGAGFGYGQNVLNEQYLLVLDVDADRARQILDDVNAQDEA